jgi:hypothetical protein
MQLCRPPARPHLAPALAPDGLERLEVAAVRVLLLALPRGARLALGVQPAGSPAAQWRRAGAQGPGSAVLVLWPVCQSCVPS